MVFPGKLSRKIVGMLAAFFLVALAAIGMTLYLSWQLEGVAAAINDAGSQRMRTYRMVHLMSHGLENREDAGAFAASLNAELERFDQVLRDLRQGDPSRPMAPPRDGEVQRKLLAVEDSWRQAIRPLVADFLSQAPDRRAAVFKRFDSQLEGFVGSINDLVLAMEQSYAANTNLLRSVQAALVLMAALGTVILIWFFMHQVIRPVSELHAGIRRMGKNDLGVRVPVESDDELGGLAKGFNEMAEHLQAAYARSRSAWRRRPGAWASATANWASFTKSPPFSASQCRSRRCARVSSAGSARHWGRMPAPCACTPPIPRSST